MENFYLNSIKTKEKKSFEKQKINEKIIQSNSIASDYLKKYIVYCTFLKRNIEWPNF